MMVLSVLVYEFVIFCDYLLCFIEIRDKLGLGTDECQYYQGTSTLGWKERKTMLYTSEKYL